MPWFKTKKLSTGTPLLVSGESLNVTVSNVVLSPANSLPSEGNLYITTQRLIFIDKNRLALEIAGRSVENCEIESSTDLEHLTLLVNVEQQWICSICSFSNAASTDICATCGVPMQKEDSTPESSANTATESINGSKLGECPQCTFMNHPSLKFCEMCSAPLKQKDAEESSKLKFVIPALQAHEILDKIRALSSSSRRSNDPPPGENQASIFGINKLQKHSKYNHEQSTKILDMALSSSDGFRKVAKELVAISERLGTPNVSPIPVVIGATSADQIAHELANFLIGSDVLALKGGMLTFHDLFALYNRSRGMSLIMPQELIDALDLCERLDIPIRCRTLESGLRVVESRGGLDQALKRLLHWITTESENQPWRACSGFSAREISEHFGYSVQIAAEELSLAESRGSLCRDESISGLRFFPNMIAKAGEN